MLLLFSLSPYLPSPLNLSQHFDKAKAEITPVAASALGYKSVKNKNITNLADSSAGEMIDCPIFKNICNWNRPIYDIV